MPLSVDLLNPSAEVEKGKHKLKRLVQSPNSYFMDVKCPGCYKVNIDAKNAVQNWGGPKLGRSKVGAVQSWGGPKLGRSKVGAVQSWGGPKLGRSKVGAVQSWGGPKLGRSKVRAVQS